MKALTRITVVFPQLLEFSNYPQCLFPSVYNMKTARACFCSGPCPSYLWLKTEELPHTMWGNSAHIGNYGWPQTKQPVYGEVLMQEHATLVLLAFPAVSVCTLTKGQSNFQSKELVSPTAPMKFDHLVGLQSTVLSNILLLKHSKSTVDDITADCKSPSCLNSTTSLSTIKNSHDIVANLLQ